MNPLWLALDATITGAVLLITWPYMEPTPEQPMWVLGEQDYDSIVRSAP